MRQISARVGGNPRLVRTPNQPQDLRLARCQFVHLHSWCCEVKPGLALTVIIYSLAKPGKGVNTAFGTPGSTARPAPVYRPKVGAMKRNDF